MALDTRYVPLFSLQEVFIDSLSGAELSGGTVEFYSDNSQSVAKLVYQLQTGNVVPPNYQYVSIGSMLTLSSVGTFVDTNGADIVPYLFPYDSGGNVELYYIVVKNSAGVVQFTRHGVPNISTSSTGGNNPNLINHVPNGQFQLHNPGQSLDASGVASPLPSTTFAYGGVRGTVKQLSIAQGGIYFERSSSSVAVDTISFTQKTQYYAPSSASPRYTCNINRSVSSPDAVCGFVVRFMDVNKFTNPDTDPLTQPKLTFLFNAKLLAGTSLTNVAVNRILYYGTSGSTTAQLALESGLTITNAETQFATTFANTPDTNAIIGSLNDDFVEFEISFPTTGTFDVQLTDIMLLNGTYTGGAAPGNTLFPEVTNGKFLLDAASNVAPTTQSPFTTGYYPEDASNFYLPMLMTKDGWTYDYGQIGRVEGLFVESGSQVGNLLYCDGSQYLVSDYSTLGIPYSRLKSILFSTAKNGPLFGTGANFINCNVSTTVGSQNQMILITNKAGAVTDPADGAAITGFNFAGSKNTGGGVFDFNSYANSSNRVVSLCKTAGNALAAVSTAGAPGMSGGDLHQFNGGANYAFVVATITAAALSTGIGVAGTYIDFSNTSTSYRMWFQVVGEVAPAAGGRTLIQCNFSSTMSAFDVAEVIAARIAGFQTNTVVASVVPPASSYFTFVSNATTYYTWYKVAGAGAAPSQPAAQLIEVDLLGTETTAQVAFKTQTAINGHYFAVPDLRGYFLRGNDPTGLVDVNAGDRFGKYANTLSYLGTYELDQISQHSHAVSSANGAGAGSGASGTGAFTGTQGGAETRPVNVAVNWFVRY